eukprot:TRINITY_DN175_c0_g1_i13.p3 TRINITY_DN175_c0_g1~~TRINITY_DN175_c0_g1_i13.p3  ORF type:complete len:125 (-),score=48.90 TRINITY_DN175_c0_g1_i13:87-461(-)
MGWGGKSKGKGASWGKASWAPAWQPMFQKGWDKGKGKGKRRIEPEKTAWIGGLPADSASVELNKALVEHLKQAGNCKFVKIGKSGTGSAGFASAEDVQNAIATLNGSVFQGSVIEVDVWTKKEA